MVRIALLLAVLPTGAWASRARRAAAPAGAAPPARAAISRLPAAGAALPLLPQTPDASNPTSAEIPPQGVAPAGVFAMPSNPGAMSGSESSQPPSGKTSAETSAAGASAVFDQAKARAALPIESFTLPNGLTVVLQSDRSNPIVAVSITYKVGSQDERPGRSGFAHLFEHLMAQGTKSLKPREISKLVESNGGVRNAFTTRTNTTYHSLVPRGALEMILWAESERMHTLNVDARALALEQQVVLEEMRLRYLNAPYRKAQDQGMAETAFSRWENRHTTIGEARDVRDAVLQDVRDFYEAHYAPNNAVIALAGDLSRDEAEQLVRRYFEKIPAKPVPPPPALDEAPLAADSRRVIDDPLAKVPKLMAAWRAPRRGTKDFWSLLLLSEILSGDDENPLYQALVQGARSALSASANFPWWTSHAMMRANPELFGVVASLKPGASADQALGGIEAVLARFSSEGARPGELERAKAQIKRQWLKEFDFLLDRAQMLSLYAALIGPPENLWNDLESLLAVTARDVAEAAGRWLNGPKAVVEVRPAAAAAEAPRDAEPAVPAETPRGPGDPRPPIGATRAATPPKLHRFTLSNGLKVVFARDPRLPLLEARLALNAGRVSERRGEDALSNAAAALLFKGDAGRDARAVAEAFSRLGYAVDTELSAERLRLSASGVAENAQAFFAELGRVLSSASYPEAEVALWRENLIERLASLRSDPDFMTGERLKAELYPGHPYGKPFPDEAKIGAVGSQALRRFHSARLAPGGATLVVTGDLEPAALRRMLEAGLAPWTGSSARKPVPAPPRAGAARVAFVERPGSRQVNLTMAQTVALQSKDEDYLAFQVMNHILGGSSQGRLFLNLRVEKGYTYGSYSRAEPRRRGLLWTAEAQVRPEVATASLSEMRREIERMRAELIAPEALESVKRYLGGVFLIRLSSLDRFADYVLQLKREGKDPEAEMRSYLARLEKLTPEDIRRVARAYLEPDAMVTVAVGQPSLRAELEGARP